MGLRLTSSLILCWITMFVIFNRCAAAPRKNHSRHHEDCESRLRNNGDLALKLFSPQGKRYAQITPLMEVMPALSVDISHGGIISSQTDCRKSSGHSDRLNRPLCPFHHQFNYNPKRVPATIIETVCSCSTPNHHQYQFLTSRVRCIPQIYQIRVLIFNENCDEYEEKIEDITLGCTAIYENVDTSSEEIIVDDGEDVPV